MKIKNAYGPAETSLWVSKQKINFDNHSLKIKEVIPLTIKDKCIIETSNSSILIYPKDKSIHQLIENQAVNNPENIAVVSSDKYLTFQELNNEANRIAHNLLDKGIGKGDIVAVILPRTSHLIPAIIGVLKTGAAYMPVDPSYPQERIDYLLTESQAKFRIDESNIEILCLNNHTGNPDIPVSMSDYFCALHTSGSTGKPKLTVLTQQNLLNFLYANLDFWKDVDTVISVTIVTFDIFMQDTLLSLALGKKVILASNDQIYNQSEFEKMFENEENVMFFSTPTKLTSYIKQSKTAGFLKKITSLIVGGEVFTDELYDLITDKISAHHYRNGYGPAETTIGVSFTDNSTPQQNSMSEHSMHTVQRKTTLGVAFSSFTPPKRFLKKIFNAYGPAETSLWISKQLWKPKSP